MQNTPNNPISPNPLFSVLIANYNNGKYLMDAIESVRRQTYTHWEIILVALKSMYVMLTINGLRYKKN